MKRALIALGLIALATCALPLSAQQQPLLARQTFSANGQLPVFQIAGQTVCGYGMSGSGSATITPKGASDGGYSYHTVNSHGFGAQTSNGDYGGWLNDLTGPPVLSNFYVAVTVSSGTVTAWESCSTTGSGGTQVISSSVPMAISSLPPVTVANATPWNVVTAPPPVFPATPFPVTQASVPWSVHDSAPVQPSPLYTVQANVNTPAPCATPTCNSVVWQGTSPWQVTAPLLKSLLTSATASSSCLSLEVNAGQLVAIVNAGSSMAVTITLYDEGATPGCSVTDTIFGPVQLGANQTQTIGVPVSSGIAAYLSGNLSGNLSVVRI